ncbi:hypothetical protein GCM10009839_86460 [Catenulispora yoronensis]|uniref:DUF1918 domain-containing protein n=1 Tax=Catenulispora yoronensis TaxID=450799 RepID=A0ABN2VGR0_9ACTN
MPASAGDRIDIGNGKVGIIVEVRAENVFVVSWAGGGRSTVAPDHRAHIESGYFARLVEDAQAAARAARSQAASRGWDTRRRTAASAS